MLTAATSGASPSIAGHLALVVGDLHEGVATYGELIAAARKQGSRVALGETRVAHLAATGLTNRQIAQRLYITIRTVEIHLLWGRRPGAPASSDRGPEQVDEVAI
ncbi:LuxR C-terminal-related transcriptional regulator [Microbispora sp. KK1-11]|uniref:LuxR C-terminal-related transcriptional regulator n=1 Tax=Microbispora sp. KK1-11 TaxID=2053005 RepID=UPI001158BC35|nr:hypothetical protein FLW16_02860 [Microbispora sp. KK1-11]